MRENIGETGTDLIKLGIGIAVMAVAIPFAVNQFTGLVSGVINPPTV